MKFRKKWNLAGTVIREARFRAQLSSNPSYRSRAKEQPEKIMRNVKRSNTISMAFTTFLVVVLGGVSLGLIAFGDPSQSGVTTMTVGVGSFLLLSFVLIFFLNLVGTSGFFMSGVATFAAMLPMSQDDFEEIMFLAFMRVFAGPSIAIMTVLPVGFLILIGPMAALSAFFACGITILVSFSILILVAQWYQRKSLEQPGSKLSTVVRVLTGVMLMVGIIAVYSVGNYLPVLVDLLISLSQNYGLIIDILFSLVFPFTLGMVTAIAAYGLQVSTEIIVLSIGAALFYAVVAVRGYRIARERLRKAVMGGVETQVATIVNQPIETTGSIRAIIKKDLRLATRDLGSLTILIFPLMLLIAWAPSLAIMAEGGIDLLSLVTMMVIIQSFSGISITGLLGIDTQGASIYDGLPLSSMMNLKAKAVLFTVTYVFFMTIVSIILLIGIPFSWFALFIPFVQMPLGYGLALAVGGVLSRVIGKGRIVAVNPVNNQKATFIAFLVSLSVGSLPILGFLLGTYLAEEILVGIGLQGILIIIESLAAVKGIPKLLKN